MNLAQRLHEVATQRADKVAVVFEGETYTYAQLDTLVARYVTVLRELGVQPGDRVAYQLPKCMDFVGLHLATLSLGGVTLPLNVDYKGEEVADFLSDSGARLLVTDAARLDQNREVLGQLPDLETALVDAQAVPGSHCLPALLERAEPGERSYPTGGDDVAVICYTSGTTGRSKGAMITHRNLVSNTLDLAQVWRWTEDDVLLHVLPLFHVHGLLVALHGSLHAGATAIMHRRFEPGRTWEALEREGCTLFMAVPTIYQRLMNEWDAMARKPDLGAMRLFVSGSAPLSENLFARFEAATGVRILERYGMTETSMNTSNPYAEAERKPGSVGYPLPSVQIRIASATGEPAPAGEVGEVMIRGDNVFAGYWQMPDKTRESFSDGWFHSVDLGYQDAGDGGRLYLVGRSKELIITGGYNVYPKEIETVLETHPAVKECAVVGLPDDDFGERVVGAVVLADDAAAPSPETLIGHCKDKLASYKCPKQIAFLSALPRNAMGKLQKNQIAELAVADAGGGAS